MRTSGRAARHGALLLLLLVVLTGFFGMHGLQATAAQLGGHLTATPATSTAVTPDPTSAHGESQDDRGHVPNGAAAVDDRGVPGGDDAVHDAMAGCLLALTGLVALALLVALRPAPAVWSQPAHRHRPPLLPTWTSGAGFAPPPRTLLCVMRV